MICGMNNGEPDYRHLGWKEIDRTVKAECGIFDVYSVRRSDDKGRSGSFVLIDAPDWVTVIPLTRIAGRDHVLMVRQYRHGSGEITLEFPAGAVNRGEDPAATARRELLEETGYRAGSIECLGHVSPNPAFMNNSVYTFVAADLEAVQGQTLDQHEIVDVEPVPLDEVMDRMGHPPYTNGIMMISLAWFIRHTGRR